MFFKNTTDKPRVGMVVAIEIGAVLKKYGTPQNTIEQDGYTVSVYENENYILYAVSSGAGEISAATATQFLISVCRVQLIVNFGVVGGLTPEMGTANLCVIEKVIHYDYITTGWLNLPRGQYPGEDSPYLEADPHLIKKAQEVMPGLQTVVCASADKFVDDPEQKSLLHKTYHADICEMESAGILITCRRSKIPCILLKCVSDSLLGGGKEFFTELERTSEKCIELTDKVIKDIVRKAE